MKNKLDILVKKYETVEFIKDDPILFIHKTSVKKEQELYGFIASLFAYGNRKVFIKKINEIYNKCNYDILNYVKNGDFANLNDIEYRFAKNNDIVAIFKILSTLYNESDGLEELFSYSWNNAKNIENDLLKYKTYFQTVIDYFYSNVSGDIGQGFYHMLPSPKNGGAMKRLNMLLRWFIRKSDVDIGIWNYMNAKDLLIPLDVHVAQVSRDLGLLNRKSNDLKAVLELTNKLKEFCPEDPAKYDFAMFGLGINSK